MPSAFWGYHLHHWGAAAFKQGEQLWAGEEISGNKWEKDAIRDWWEQHDIDSLLWYYMLAILNVYKLTGQLMTALQSRSIFWSALPVFYVVKGELFCFKNLQILQKKAVMAVVVSPRGRIAVCVSRGFVVKLSDAMCILLSCKQSRGWDGVSTGTLCCLWHQTDTTHTQVQSSWGQVLGDPATPSVSFPTWSPFCFCEGYT